MTIKNLDNYIASICIGNDSAILIKDINYGCTDSVVAQLVSGDTEHELLECEISYGADGEAYFLYDNLHCDLSGAMLLN